VGNEFRKNDAVVTVWQMDLATPHCRGLAVCGRSLRGKAGCEAQTTHRGPACTREGCLSRNDRWNSIHIS